MHYLRGKRVPMSLRFEIQDYYAYKFERHIDGASMVLVGRCDHLPYTGRRTAHTRCRTCGNSE